MLKWSVTAVWLAVLAGGATAGGPVVQDTEPGPVVGEVEADPVSTDEQPAPASYGDRRMERERPELVCSGGFLARQGCDGGR